MSSSSFASSSSYAPVPLSKQNAAGLSAEQSLVLPQREVSSQEEELILQALVSIYAPAGQQQNNEWMEEIFANDVIYSGPKGDVLLGHAGLIKLQEQASSSSEARKLQQRLLVTPETLPVGSMVIDQVTSEGEKMKRSLIVLKRREVDGKVVQWTEEEGHRRATAPLAARAASASNFHSPTDQMLSPCTSKLNLAKKKHFGKAQPRSLFGTMASSQNNTPKTSTIGGGGRMQSSTMADESMDE